MSRVEPPILSQTTASFASSAAGMLRSTFPEPLLGQTIDDSSGTGVRERSRGVVQVTVGGVASDADSVPRAAR